MLPESERLPDHFVDYSLPVEKVYTQTARYILERSSTGPRPDDLEQLLRHAEATLLRYKGVWNLPSWVPDWSLTDLTTPSPNRHPNPCLDELWAEQAMNQWWAFVEEPEILVCFGADPQSDDSSQYSVDALLSPVFPPPSTLPLELRKECLANLQSLLPALRSTAAAVSLLPEVLTTFTTLWDAIHASQDSEGVFNTTEPYQHDRLQGMISSAGYMARAAVQFIIVYLKGEDHTSFENDEDTFPVEAEETSLGFEGKLFAHHDHEETFFEPEDLVGRRLASVGGILAVVPCHTRPGDKAISVLPSGRLYITREELDVESIRSAWEEAIVWRAGLMTNKTQTLRGCVDFWGRIVGECFMHRGLTNELGQRYSPYGLCTIALL
jgi:hypothetical protein